MKLCPTLCYPVHCSLPGFSVQGILQTRILEWVAYPFSSRSSWPRNRTRVSWIAGGFFTSWAKREGITIYLLGWPKSPKYKLKTPNAEKDVEQQQFSIIISLSVKWYSHFGRQFINFLQHQTHSYHAAAAVASVVSDSVRPHRRQPTRLLCPWYSPVKNTGVGCHFLLQSMKVKSESKVTQLSNSSRPHGL